ncbi:MAG: hypothetical protein AAGE89_12255 [Pseudomonadota bacterium]
MRCACGQVAFEAVGEPIVAGVCYCDDCQAGGRAIEALPDAPTALDADGGADYLIYRDDKIRCVKGEKLIAAHKLKAKSHTTRYYTKCCHSALYVKFGPGHWTSTFRNRFDVIDLPPVALPNVEMRNMTRFRTSGLPYPDDAPTYRKFPFRLFWELIKARLHMIVG